MKSRNCDKNSSGIALRASSSIVASSWMRRCRKKSCSRANHNSGSEAAYAGMGSAIETCEGAKSMGGQSAESCAAFFAITYG
ncbi:hypothetical protein M514_01153 [Trichuris suis]|uniref:Uncharacterized protein n=1 Tax=Trichuris suis TaxID=68888 RepID=A0A085NN56_9BILA|nr:hypothetical protein M514_01153 [Trichuris suis]